MRRAPCVPQSPEPLKLVALDEDDLKILSAHLQDAVLRMSDMAWVPSEHRFAAILNRFDWLAAVGRMEPPICAVAAALFGSTR